MLAHTTHTVDGDVMKTYPITDDAGNLLAFEVENVYIRLGEISRLFVQQEGVTDMQKRKLFSSDNELRLAFKFNGTPLVVAEPFGDSSRYWIGPKGDLTLTISDELSILKGILESYQPPLFLRLLGDFVTLKFLKAG